MKPSDESDMNLRYSKKDTNGFFQLSGFGMPKNKKFECFLKVLMQFSKKRRFGMHFEMV